MVKQERVSVPFHYLLAFIPIWPLWVWCFYRIESLKRGVMPILVSFGISIGFQMVLPYPYGLGIVFVVAPWPVFFTLRNWSRDWNAKFSTGT